jgi:hypothetical protein
MDTPIEVAKGGPDVWIRLPLIQASYAYYQMVLVYVEDIFVISHKSFETFN